MSIIYLTEGRLPGVEWSSEVRDVKLRISRPGPREKWVGWVAWEFNREQLLQNKIYMSDPEGGKDDIMSEVTKTKMDAS